MIDPVMLSSLHGQPLMVEPTKAEVILNVLTKRAGMSVTVNSDASMVSPNLQTKRYAAAGGVGYSVNKGAALIRVEGTLTHRDFGMAPSSGATGYPGLQANIEAADNDPDVDGVVFDMFSPGGHVLGCFETAKLIGAMEKPTIAIVDGQSTSAAYALASQTDYIVASRYSAIGSIGVMTMLLDLTENAEKQGVKAHFVTAGANKVDGHPLAGVSKELLAEMQVSIDAIYSEFVSLVADGREAMTEANVRSTEAAVFSADRALELGLIDEVGDPLAALRSFQKFIQ